jgi:hypothetical protein
LQSLVELAKYVVVAEEGCYADDLASRPDSPIVIPPTGTDQFGAMNQVVAEPLSRSRSASVGRLNMMPSGV